MIPLGWQISWSLQMLQPGQGSYRLGEEPSTTISLAEVKTRIEDAVLPMERGYSDCVSGVMYRRSQVRSQIEGTHRELTLGGYAESEPFIRFVVTIVVSHVWN